MATWFCDFAGGNDANNGTSFAQRVKTITTGIASKYSAGDTIKVAASPDPLDTGVTSAWTNGSRVVTLGSALTQKIWYGGDGVWTPSTNVTATTSTTRKSLVGNASSLAIATAFTTGLVAFFATGTLNLSAYQQISFWIQTNAAINSGWFRIDLCSDVAGVTPVDSFTVNFATVSGNSNLGAAGTNRWIPVTLNKGSALGSAIKSIALTALSDPGTVTVLLDNIIACKAPGAGCLTLQSLIGKNYAKNVDTWYGVGTINGTAVSIDGSTSTRGDQATNTQGYAGTTETVELYTRETVKLPAIAVANSAVNGTSEPAKTGTVSGAVTFSFGWDTVAMTSQSGETWFDGLGGLAVGWTVADAIDFINTDLFCAFVRFSIGASILGRNGNQSFVACNNNEAAGIQTNQSGASRGGTIIVNANFTNNNGCSLNTNGTGFADSRIPTVFNVLNASGNQRQGCAPLVGPSAGQLGTRVIGTTFSQNATSGCLLQGAGPTFINCNFNNNGTDISVSGAFSPGSIGLFNGCTFSSGILVGTGFVSFDDSWVYTYNNGGVTGTHAAYTDGATVVSAAPRVVSAGTYSWQITFNAVGAQNRITSAYPVRWALNSGNPVWCKANQQVTWKVWVNTSASSVSATLTVPGGQIAGVASDITNAANTSLSGQWQQLSVTFTPTVEGDVYAYVYAYGTTLNTTCFIDETDTKPNTDPGVANVLSTASYNFNGAAETGTYVAPTVAQVKTGVTFAVSSTGTYDGSDRWTDPGSTNVLAGVTYKANSPTNNETGSLDIATAVWGAAISGFTTAGTFGKVTGGNLDAAMTTRAAAATAVSNADYTSARAAKLDDLDATVSSRLASGSYTAPDNTTIGTINTKLGTPATSVSADIAAVKTDVDARPTNPLLTTDIRLNHLDADVSSRAAAATAVSNADLTPTRAAKLDDLDATISSRLAGASYTAPDNADIAAIKAKTDNLPADPASESLIIAATTSIKTDVDAIPTNPLLTTDVRLNHLDADVSTRLPTSSYTAPDNTTIGAVNTKIGTPAVSVSADVAAIKTDVDAIPTDPLLTSDVRLNHLDADISSIAAGSGPSAATIADAVWDSDLSAHTTVTKFGGFIQKLLSVAKFLGLK